MGGEVCVCVCVRAVREEGVGDRNNFKSGYFDKYEKLPVKAYPIIRCLTRRRGALLPRPPHPSFLSVAAPVPHPPSQRTVCRRPPRSAPLRPRSTRSASGCGRPYRPVYFATFVFPPSSCTVVQHTLFGPLFAPRRQRFSRGNLGRLVG